MELHGIELKPGMILVDDKSNKAVVIPHKSNGIAFVSYNHSNSWSVVLDNVLIGGNLRKFGIFQEEVL